ncbi:hypothetical protein ABN154_00595 [Klebsiella michiganensis]|uniref:hypothetical protein n=1 Tax=Klebsiella michiganensis TaxID=1134687 RepID=UPI0032DBE885
MMEKDDMTIRASEFAQLLGVRTVDILAASKTGFLNGMSIPKMSKRERFWLSEAVEFKRLYDSHKE